MLSLDRQPCSLGMSRTLAEDKHSREMECVCPCVLWGPVSVCRSVHVCGSCIVYGKLHACLGTTVYVLFYV